MELYRLRTIVLEQWLINYTADSGFPKLWTKINHEDDNRGRRRSVNSREKDLLDPARHIAKHLKVECTVAGEIQKIIDHRRFVDTWYGNVLLQEGLNGQTGVAQKLRDHRRFTGVLRKVKEVLN
jgi:hypothetical protein